MNLSILGVGSLAAVLLSGGSYLLYDSFVSDGSQTYVPDLNRREEFKWLWLAVKEVYNDVRDPVDIYKRCLNKVSSHIGKRDLWISKEDFVSSNEENLSREEKYWKDNGTFDGTTEQFNESMWWIELSIKSASVFGDWRDKDNFDIEKYRKQVPDDCSFQLRDYFKSKDSELKSKYPGREHESTFRKILGYSYDDEGSQPVSDLKISVENKDVLVEKISK